jgi:hypothetical protein
VATDNDTSFDAALAALDVEPTHHPDRMVTTYDILGLDAVREAHRAEVERAVAEERDRNLDVLADFYSKTRAGRYASLSKEARQARLDVLTHAYSRMGGGLPSTARHSAPPASWSRSPRERRGCGPSPPRRPARLRRGVPLARRRGRGCRRS